MGLPLIARLRWKVVILKLVVIFIFRLVKEVLAVWVIEIPARTTLKTWKDGMVPSCFDVSGNKGPQFSLFIWWFLAKKLPNLLFHFLFKLFYLTLTFWVLRSSMYNFDLQWRTQPLNDLSNKFGAVVCLYVFGRAFLVKEKFMQDGINFVGWFSFGGKQPTKLEKTVFDN